MSTIQSQLEVLASRFTDEVMRALRTASLEELLAGKPGRAVGGGVRTRGGGGQPDPLATPGKKRGNGARLPRRSQEEIAKALDKIVLLVKTHKNGMRAEEIRAKLGMEPKEMPRILKLGVSTKKLASKGQKRATTYFVR